MKQPALSIRAVLISLGALSILVVAGLAGFELLSIGRQIEVRKRVTMLEQALFNQMKANTSMEEVRTDVLRAVLSTIGTNKDGGASIRTELLHHENMVKIPIAENEALPLSPHLHDSYAKLTELVALFNAAGRKAVELALTDPVAGSVSFERLKSDFSELETLMGDMENTLRAEARHVREGAAANAKRAKQMVLTSSFISAVLLALITAIAARIAQKITAALASSQKEAHRLALHDPLTGLANRAFLGERLKQALAQARRQKTGLAVLYLDLDRFKQVNDTLGHPAGDALLCAVADRLRGGLRRCDTVARLGGDEFAIIQAPLDKAEDAGQLAQRIVEALSEPYILGDYQAVIGTSVGIALASADTTDGGHLLKMADIALYRAKSDGRGLFRVFEPEMDLTLQTRRALAQDLRRAVGMGEFELHYQPLINLPSGRVGAMEALVRWRHPERGLVGSNDFIPLAEETGLAGPIGAWVLHQACADAAGWPSDVRVAVNVSAAQFKTGLVAAVRDALAASALLPGRLELEITETALLADADATLATLRELRAMGVRIAMDDFGTGYSSLGYLRSFPFDKIKIDRSFIADIETSADCMAIVRAVVGLGSNLGIVVTAEGVETPAQLDRLRAKGCGQVQGHLFSRPVPARDVAALLGQMPLPAEAGHVHGALSHGCPELA